MQITTRLAGGAFASVLALSVSLTLSTPARAESEADAPTIVVTAQDAIDDARATLALRPGGANLVGAASFADTVAVSLRDALAFSPGVYAQPRFGQEVRLSIRGSGISRGYHMRGLTLLQDGIPINLADDNGDFQELDPQVFQHIEVYRGANALRLGGSTLGGAINVVTPTGRTAPAAELRIDGGSFATVRAKAAAAFATARGDAYLALTTDHSDGDRVHAGRHAVRFNGNAGLRLGERVETRFYATLSHIRQNLPGALTLGQALTTPALSLPDNIVKDQERDIDSLRLQNRTVISLDNGAIAFGAFYNAKQLYHPIFQLLDQKARDRGVFASLDLDGQLGGVDVALTLGSQARFGTVAARQYLNVGGKRGAQTGDARQAARTINSYGELRVTPVDGLTLIAGGIHSHGRRAVDNRLNPAMSDARSYDLFAPKFGVLWAPGDAVQVYANYARSVELPGFLELVQQPVQGFVPIDAQRAWTAEIGTRGHAGIARWDISLYRANVRGEMLQFLVTPDVPAATFNAGRTRHQGIEAGLELALAPWARLRQVYQYNDFRFRADAAYGDNRLPVVPRHQYRAELRLGTDRLSLSPNIEWMPRGGWADYANSVRAPGYALFGLGAEAVLRDGITLFVDARNLTGKKAVGDISAVIAADAGTVAFYPVERRAFYGGLRASF
ncbi:TonB-dependent receptor family protein [Sphingomonas flavalba]|uniref:TonB-dependent receptor family protein n=1 Tax=Sphingomonas flavalba TaxID=2559804 RepID=UPI0039E092C1